VKGASFVVRASPKSQEAGARAVGGGVAAGGGGGVLGVGGLLGVVGLGGGGGGLGGGEGEAIVPQIVGDMSWYLADVMAQVLFYLSRSVYNVSLQKSIRARIRHLVLYFY